MASRHPVRAGAIIALALAMGGIPALQARAQAEIELFDAHVHYNQEPNPFYSLDKVLEIFRRNNVTDDRATPRFPVLF